MYDKKKNIYIYNSAKNIILILFDPCDRALNRDFQSSIITAVEMQEETDRFQIAKKCNNAIVTSMMTPRRHRERPHERTS